MAEATVSSSMTNCPVVLADYLARLSPNRPYGPRGGVASETRIVSFGLTLACT
jgi:hypothetical protein